MCNSKITLTTLIENALQALHQIQTPFWSPRSLGNGFSRPQITWKPLFRDPAHFEIAFSGHSSLSKALFSSVLRVARSIPNSLSEYPNHFFAKFPNHFSNHFSPVQEETTYILFEQEKFCTPSQRLLITSQDQSSDSPIPAPVHGASKEKP